MRLRSLVAVSLVATSLAACADAVPELGPVPADPGCLDVPLGVRVGVPEAPDAASGSLPLDAPVAILEHPRGGWYVPARIDLEHSGSIVWLDLGLVDLERGVVLSQRRLRVQVPEVGSCAGQLPWIEAFLDPAAWPDADVPASLDGVRAELLVAVEDDLGRAGTAVLPLSLAAETVRDRAPEWGGGKP